MVRREAGRHTGDRRDEQAGAEQRQGLTTSACRARRVPKAIA